MIFLDPLKQRGYYEVTVVCSSLCPSISSEFSSVTAHFFVANFLHDGR